MTDQRQRAHHVADVIVDACGEEPRQRQRALLRLVALERRLARRVAADVDDERQAERQRQQARAVVRCSSAAARRPRPRHAATAAAAAASRSVRSVVRKTAWDAASNCRRAWRRERRSGSERASRSAPSRKEHANVVSAIMRGLPRAPVAGNRSSAAMNPASPRAPSRARLHGPPVVLEPVHDVRLVRPPEDCSTTGRGGSRRWFRGASRCSNTCCRCRRTGSASPCCRSAQLKILQEVITLAVFVPFAMLFMGATLKLDYLWAGLVHAGRRLLHLPGVTCAAAALAHAMHLHILGICGTFMGGIAAIARRAGHAVTGCDANVYPPMSTQLAGARHRADRGLRRGAARRRREGGRRVRRRQRRLARQSADGGDPGSRPAATFRARSGSPSTCCATSGCSRSPARTARRRRRRCSRGSSSARGSSPGFLIGGVPLDFGVSARADRQRVLRDRGRRIRHRVLRQALEIRPLPAAHGDPQQSRIRPRRHLSRPRGDRDAVPSSRAHGAAATGASSSTARDAALARVLARGAGARSSASAPPSRLADARADWTIADDGAVTLGGAPQAGSRLAHARPRTTG